MTIHVAQRIRELAPSPTLTLDAKVKALQAAGQPILNLTLGEPDFPTPSPIKEAAIEAIHQNFTHYTQAAGIPQLRELIAQKLLKENHIKYAPSEIIVGVGTKHLLYEAFQVLCDNGDEVLIPTPTWATYVEQVKLAEGKPVLVPLKPPFKLRARDLQKFTTKKTKILLLNSPANPTGAMIEKSELKKIAQFALQHDLWIISDEIYEKITYGTQHVSIASLSKEIQAQTITINGFSKAYAMTGWRVGYAAGPKEIIDAMTTLQGQMTSNTCSIAQKAALGAFSKNQSALKKMQKEFQKRRNFVLQALQHTKGIDVLPPEGAFYIFAKVKNSQQWCETLLSEQHVAVVPGEAFLAQGYFRLSFAAPFAELRKAVKKIKVFVETHKGMA